MGATASKKERQAAEVDAAIAAMSPGDRAIAERLHEVITTAVPELAPRTWYKQPAYALDDEVVVFFRGADVDGERYLSLGFSGEARLDEGPLWATSFAVTGIGEQEAARVAALVRKAVARDRS